MRQMARTVGDALAMGLASGDRVGDLMLQAEARALTRLLDPPLEIEGTGAMRHCQLRLTRTGEWLRHLGPAGK